MNDMHRVHRRVLVPAGKTDAQTMQLAAESGTNHCLSC
jgi:hypothetical protein